jgi:hypothetical protein
MSAFGAMTLGVTLLAIKQKDYTKAALKGEVNQRPWRHDASRYRQLNCGAKAPHGAVV